MKSKTSFFNRTIFKKNFTHYWPLWVLYLGYLLLTIPIDIWQKASSKWYVDGYDEVTRMHYVVKPALDAAISPVPIFLFAGVVALAVFSYLYSSKNANMMHALPVDRRELYVTNYVSGLSFLVIPELVAFLAAVLVCLASQITSTQYLFLAFLCQVGITFFAYSLAVFVAMFTGQLFAMPVYYVILNYLYVGCLYIVSRVVGLLSYGISDAWNPGPSCILSPIYYMGNNLYSRFSYVNDTETINGIEICGMYLVAIYAAAAVVFVILAYLLYKRRQVETAGDWVSIGVVKPIFRWGVALCGGLFLSTAFTEMLKQSKNVNTYICIVIAMVIVGFVGFFGAEMLLEKNFKVFRKKRIFEWVGFSVAAVAFITLFQVDAFGIERRIPAADEVETAFVYMDYPVQIAGDDIARLLELHQQAIDKKDEYLEIANGETGYYMTTFRYYLKDGTRFERHYSLPITEAYITDSSTPPGQILAWEKVQENLKREIMGVNYAENEYLSGYIDLYSEDANSRNYVFNAQELEQIVAAVSKDIAEGNFDSYYMPSSAPEDMQYYTSNLTLEYYNRNGIYDNWDYYYNYSRYANPGNEAEKLLKQGETVSISSGGIRFGKGCVNTIAALEELGIVNDTWKLMTYEEYERSAK